MEEARKRRLLEIIQHANTLARSEQEVYLREACAGDEQLLSLSTKALKATSVFDSVLPELLGPYQTLEHIATSPSATVWLARDTTLQREVVLKVLPSFRSGNNEAKARFQREARIVARLNHPNIVTLYGTGFEEGRFFLVMEYVPGQSLQSRLAEGRLTTAQALAIACSIAKALSYAHRRGIIHRDLKPSNVIVTDESGVKVVDFGVAKLMDNGLGLNDGEHTQPGTVIGTKRYMPPEQWRGQAADHRSDIFSFGAIFYEMLTGTPAFDHASENPYDAVGREQLERVPARFRSVVERCLKVHPTDRYQSMSEVVSQLEAFLKAPSSTWRLLPTLLKLLGVTALGVVALILWPHAPARERFLPSRTVSLFDVLLIPYNESSHNTHATETMQTALQQLTEQNSGLTMHVAPRPVALSVNNSSVGKIGEDEHATIVIWGETQDSEGHPSVTNHLALLNPNLGFHASRISTWTGAASSSDWTAPARAFVLTAFGVSRFNAKDDRRAVPTLGGAVRNADSAAKFIDPSVSRFYHGAAEIRLIDASGCLKSDSRTCDLDSTLREAAEAIEDFSGVLTRHPHHLGSLWQRGLAYAKRCDLQLRAGHEVQTDCGRAVDDFTAALNTPPDQTFLAQLPDKADVVWNRGFTHLMEARLATLPRNERIAQYALAIQDFDGVLNGGTEYASFLNSRRAIVVEHRAAANSELAELRQTSGL